MGQCTCVVTLLQLADEAVGIGSASSFLHPLQRAVCQAVGNVVLDGPREQNRLLAYHGYLVEGKPKQGKTYHQSAHQC